MDQYKTKFVVVYLIAAIITAACLLMNGPMRPGLPLDNTVIMRMEFISENLALWQWSWIAWMFSALGLLVFLYYFSR
ncbi:hypothetical protein [Pseudoalteromonas sp. S2755]|uniref:hypothetical protein n=1 Tax=Pseudoalteromonas sp. S2755 TaxID=2066523 RepID=UPI00201633AD|nr:hypothetical protein [Pseudoalteromonas sp. S2755]